MSAHFRDGVRGHGETGREDDEGADGGEQPHQWPLEAEAPERAPREHGDEPDTGDAERARRWADQDQAEGDAV
jgi:hypothetical protein